jgi:ATP-binding cassette subfamily B protein
MRLAARYARWQLFGSLGLALLVSVPDALTALWLKLLADAVLARRSGAVGWAIGGLAVSAGGTWILRTLSQRYQMRFRDRVTIEIETHVARLQAGVAGIEHHENHEHLNRLQILRDQVMLINHIYLSLFGMIGAAVRLSVTLALLASIHPALIVLAAFAFPPVAVSAWRAGLERRVEEQAAPHRRFARHMFELGTSAGPGKDLRISGNAPDVLERLGDARSRWLEDNAPVRRVSALLHAGAWSLFGLAYFAVVAWVAAGLHRSPGSVLLALAAGGRLSQYIGSTVGEAEFLRMCINVSRRLVWLERYAAERAAVEDLPVPSRLDRGIRLEGVSFRYPGTDAWVLEDIDLELPAGAVVAVVGENGAGKTSLMKLVSKMYAPTSGRVLIDGVDLSRLPVAAWRERLAGAFQDFVRFELVARQSIGVGDLPRIDDREAVLAGVKRGGADDVLARLPHELETQLGPTWRDGVEVSIGQWQKLALARGLMRDGPLLVILDEPTASLDAETEHALFERFASAARDSTPDGRITLLVSHRFSTVRMADLIVVLDRGRLVEFGSHEELVSRVGLYAELYGIQAKAYR